MQKQLPKLSRVLAVLLLTVCAVLSGTQLAQANPPRYARYYVTPGGAGSKNGSSWSNAMDSIAFRTNISTIAYGDTIWVAAGIYHPDLSNAGNYFQIPSGVKVYGGFTGTETKLSQRDNYTNRTVLDGAGIIYNIVYFVQADSTTRLDGFTISNGNNNYGTNGLYSAGDGAGIYNEADDNGIYYSSPVIANDSFINNIAEEDGGAIGNFTYYSATASPTITNCVFVNNNAPDGGGAIYNGAATGTGYINPVITNCVFTNNTGGYGGAIINSGGSAVCNPIITGCIFNGNSASYAGGAIENYGYRGTCNPTITGCVFINNAAQYVAAIYDDDASPIYTNCTFSGNTSTSYGVVYDGGGTPTYISCIFWDNNANEIYAAGATDNVSYSDIYGGWTGAGSNNTNSNPLFMSSSNVHLSAGSPCIGTGYNGIDMGAYAYGAAVAVFYVTPGGAGAKTGASWGNAMDSITFRNYLSTASYGDAFWLSAGTYHPDLSNDTNKFIIPSGVKLYGGFAGTETALSQRNYHTNITILDGHGSTYNIVYFNNVDNTTAINGFTISNGNNPQSGAGGIGAAYTGAAIYNNTGSPVIANNIFINNYAYNNAAAIYNKCNTGTANPTVVNCLFTNNSTGQQGAAIYNYNVSGTSSPMYANCTFAHNTSGSGQVATNNGATPAYVNCIFWDSAIYEVIDISGASTVSFSDVYGGWSSAGSNNIYSNPMFISSTNEQLRVTSPCINTGSNAGVPAGITTDLAGTMRILQGTVDMGAYENPNYLNNYVTMGGAGNRSGSSWANAMDSIAFRTNIANASYGAIFWIEKGIYHPDLSNPPSYFQIPSGVKVYGGFAGTETSLSQRNVKANITELDGHYKQPNIVYFNHVDSTTTIDGFTIANAQNNGFYQDIGTILAHGPGYINSSGGGIYNNGDSSGTSNPIIANDSFANNFANHGAAIYNDGEFSGKANPTILNCSFYNNSAGGGAIANDAFDGICSPVITDCYFNANWSSSYNGGAIFNLAEFDGEQGYTSTCKPVITNCVFTNNWTYGKGAAIYSFPSGTIYKCSVTNCTFFNNTSSDSSVLYNAPGLDTSEYFIINNCIFWDNAVNEIEELNGYSPIYFSHVYYSDIKSGWAGPGSHNISSNPLFISNTKLQLTKPSPCVNTGNVAAVPAGITTDITGRARLQNGTVDMGAYETILNCAVTTSTVNATVCAGSSYIFHTKTFTTAGTHYDTLTNNAGCDSIVTINLALTNTVTSTTNVTACSVSSYSWNGHTYNTSGRDTVSLTSKGGCDSLAILVIAFKQKTTSTTSVSVCSNQLPYSWNGYNFTGAGHDTVYLTNKAGCDSITVLILTVKQTTTAIINATITQRQTYTFNGTSYSATGTYVAHLTNKAGCDSTVTLNLTVLITRYYVSPGGAGNNSGSSWTNAMDSITFRNYLPTAPHGDTFWLSAGTYHPNLSNDTNKFVVPSGVKVYGGFAGTETSLSQRSIGANITKLDGHSTIYNIIYFNHVDNTTTVDGFTISNGNNPQAGTGGLGTAYAGAAIYNNGSTSGNSNPVIANNIFKNNYAYNSAAAIYNNGKQGGTASPTIVNCLFTNNTGGQQGAAIYNYGVSGTSKSVIDNCTFVLNTSGDSSIIYNNSSSPIITNCILWDNTVKEISDNAGSASKVSYSDIRSGWTGAGSANINTNPLFISYTNPVLTIPSPCVNTGSNAGVPAGVTTDLSGGTRIQQNIVDMGAYESSFGSAVTHYYVTPGGAGSKGGGSWATAMDSIAFRINLGYARYGSVFWVAKGVYHSDLTSPTSYFTIPSGVKVYGGFIGTENTLAQRNIKTNITELDGHNTQPNIIYFNHVDSTTTIDGFTIANAADYEYYRDIGTILQNGSGPANGGGGGIFNNGGHSGSSNPIIANDSFVNNLAVDGGAIYNYGQYGGKANSAILNCSFYNNHAAGGAIFNDADDGICSPVITGCYFNGNFQITGDGGAIYNQAEFDGEQGYFSISKPAITNCTFLNNYVYNGSGAAIYSRPANGIFKCTVTNCTFFNNTATDSSVLYNEPDDTTSYYIVSNCILWDNSKKEVFDDYPGYYASSVTTSSVNYSDIKEVWTGRGSNNISSNPSFVSNSNLQLTQNSPCINTGDNALIPTGITTDILGNARITHVIVDMGAYESLLCGTVIASPTPAVSLICSGNSVSYTSPPIGSAIYTWQYTTGSITTPDSAWKTFGGNSNIATITNVTKKTYTRLEVSVPGCATTSSPTAAINIDSTALSVTISNTTATSAQLNWNSISGATYSITVNGHTYTSPTNTYTVTGLSSCHVYTATVTATGSTCGGTPTGNATINTLPTALTLTLSAGSGGAMVANWTTGKGPYKLYYGEIMAQQNLLVVNIATGTTTYTVPGRSIASGISYMAYVIDQGSTCTPMAQSNNAYYSASGGSCTGAAPVITSSTSTAVSFTFSWTGTASSYQVYYKSPSGTWTSYTTTANTYTITGAVPGTCYPFFVVNKCGTAYGWSSPIDTVCTPAQCGGPLNLVLSQPTCKGFTATWNAALGAATYQVYCAITTGVGTPTWKVSYAAGNSVTFTTFSSGTPVAVYVQSNCTNGGRSVSSNTESITTLSVGCKDNNNLPLTNASANTNTFSIYPNPNTGTFKVMMTTMATNATATLEVMDVLGRLVYTTDVTNNNGVINESIDLNNAVPSGIYMVRVRCGNDIHIAKVEIQR